MSEEHLGCHRIDGPEECRRLLLVGELNPYGSDARYALYHEPKSAAGFRLQSKILGVDARRWYLPIWRTNLCVGSWDRDEAKARAESLLAVPSPWSVVVLLGRKVADAFDRACAVVPPNFEQATRVTLGGALGQTLVSLPHPSGRSTAWNDRENVARARAVMATVARGIPWGELDATS